MTVEARSIPLLARVFYFLRHGETESNRRLLIAGSLDVELNERKWGELEGKPRAPRLRGV